MNEVLKLYESILLGMKDHRDAGCNLIREWSNKQLLRPKIKRLT
jgi:hypothetical protein